MKQRDPPSYRRMPLAAYPRQQQQQQQDELLLQQQQVYAAGIDSKRSSRGGDTSYTLLHAEAAAAGIATPANATTATNISDGTLRCMYTANQR